MLKRRISLALVLTMLLTMMMPTLAFGAVDYSGHWAEETIREWFDNDMLKGYEDGSFRPDVQITRAEFMTMVNNAFEFTEKADINFSDVDSDDWFYSEVQKAVKAGYVIGYEDNTARPGIKISRQEAALIIARIKDLSDYAAGANKFNDVHEIASWAKGGVGAVVDEKYMIGYEDNTFRPLRFISRAEAVVTFDRAIDKDVETPPVTGGGNSGSGGSNGGSNYTYAVLSGAEYDDGTTSSAITFSGYVGTVATTSSAITITAITATTSSAIEVTATTTGTSIVSTSSAIITDSRFVINVDLIDGDNIIKITVRDPEKDRSRTYYITVKKE
jgi:hypothetical protein